MAHKPEYLATRFESFIPSKPDGCWEWSGALDGAGYGRLHIKQGGKDVAALAHRIAFLLANGYLPRLVCHKCDNRKCVRPDHLFPGNHTVNNRDMVSKGRHAAQIGTQRHAKGTQHPGAKLKESDIAGIRAEYAAGGITQRALAAKFAVSQRTIAKVVRCIGWTHA